MDSKSRFRLYNAGNDEPTAPPSMSPTTGIMMQGRPRAVERANEALPALADLYQPAPPNPSSRRRSANDNPITMIESLARKGGVDPRRASIEEVLRGAWKSSPTDAVGEAIDGLSKQFGVRAPWDSGGGHSADPSAGDATSDSSSDGGRMGAFREYGMGNEVPMLPPLMSPSTGLYLKNNPGAVTRGARRGAPEPRPFMDLSQSHNHQTDQMTGPQQRELPPLMSPKTRQWLDSHPQAATRGSDMGVNIQSSPRARQNAPSRPSDPFDYIEELARRGGLDTTRSTPDQILDRAWRTNPTDDVRDAITGIVKEFNLRAPWE